MRRVALALAGLALLVAAVPFVLTVAYGVVDPPSLAVLRRHWAGARADQTWVPLDRIDPTLVRAVVMSEDARFCAHWGIDLNQIRVVLQETLNGEDPRGASTLTMQTVKNLFLWPDRSYLRKALEIPLAIWMDLALSKDRVLEIYLNIAQWGATAYGIEAAAQRYFGRSALNLNEEQALSLATMLPAPGLRNPRNPSRRHRALMERLKRELNRAPYVFDCLAPPIRP